MSTEYRISALQDFLNVPVTKLDLCLEEFKEYLAAARNINEIAEQVPEGAAVVVGDYIWVDDGERNVTFNITVQGTENEQTS